MSLMLALLDASRKHKAKSEKLVVPKPKMTIDRLLVDGGEMLFDGVRVSCQTNSMRFNSVYCDKSKYYIVDACGNYLYIHSRSRATAQRVVGDIYGRDSKGMSKYAIRVDGSF